MSVALANAWTELAEAAASKDRSGTMSRRVHPESALDLHITVSAPDGRRGLTMRVAEAAMQQVGEIPETSGLEHELIHDGAGHCTIVLRLHDSTANELFEALAADLLGVVTRAPSEQDAVRLWMGRVALWRRVLAAGRRGLSPKRQRGLFAELYFLRECIIPAVGAAVAVEAWQGPFGGRDFQLPGASIEVKSSASTEPQAVRVASERQLDAVGCPVLFLAHVSLAAELGKGESLPEMVASVRDLASGSSAAMALDEALLAAGYLAVHRPMYERTGYAIRRESLFEVLDGFPRVTEADLPPGIGNVSYDLVLDVCEPFRVERDAVLAAISEGLS